MTETVKDGDERPRSDINMLYIYLTETVEEILKCYSFEDFMDNTKTLEEIKTSSKKRLYQRFIENVKKEVIADLEHFWQQSQINEKDVAIKKLLEDQKDNEKQICWRPKTGDCQDNLSPYLIKELREKKKELESKLEQQRQIQLQIRKRVENKRDRIKQQEQVMKNFIEKLKSHSEFFDEQTENYVKHLD